MKNKWRQLLLWLGIVPCLAVFVQWSGAAPESQKTIYYGDPSNYRALLDLLGPGDSLVLQAGSYLSGLPIDNMNGTAVNPITITGPVSGGTAVFLARGCCNTVSIWDSSYVTISNLSLDGQNLAGVDGVKAESDAAWSHHITLDNLHIYNHGASQQTVAISTKSPAWNWTIRNSTIEGAGTGLYLGDSDGSMPFVNGVIEYNLIVDTVGYNAQIKHQNGRPNLPGMPTSGKTIIRHNVFSKQNNGATGGNARPNLLVGHWPLSGNGATDLYEIYGNFFYQNPTGEPLFQGEGNIALYNNLFVNDFGHAVWIQQHNDLPREVRVFNNTVVATAEGITILNGDTGYTQKVIGNASFANPPLDVPLLDAEDNVTGSYVQATVYLENPTGGLGTLDLYPNVGQLSGSVLDSSWFDSFTDWQNDFEGNLHTGVMRGAYATNDAQSWWKPQLMEKPKIIIPLSEHNYLPFMTNQ